MTSLPTKPIGISAEARFWQWVWECLTSRDRIISGRRTTRGFRVRV